MTNVEDIPEEELGVELDEAIDHGVEAAHAEHVLREMYVNLDTLADSHALSASLTKRLRAHQENVEVLIEMAEREKESADERVQAIKDRLYD